MSHCNKRYRSEEISPQDCILWLWKLVNRLEKYLELYLYIHIFKKHRKNCETALTPGIPSIPGIRKYEIWKIWRIWNKKKYENMKDKFWGKFYIKKNCNIHVQNKRGRLNNVKKKLNNRKTMASLRSKVSN